MRKLIAIFTVALLAVISGCSSGSHITLGPATANSRVAFHEWRDGKFYTTKNCVGSTLGCASSEICGEIHECNGASIGASTDWDQGKDHFPYPTAEKS